MFFRTPDAKAPSNYELFVSDIGKFFVSHLERPRSHSNFSIIQCTVLLFLKAIKFNVMILNLIEKSNVLHLK